MPPTAPAFPSGFSPELTSGKPTAGTLPFTTSFDCTLTNEYTSLSRMGRAVLSVRLPGGSYITNWRSGTTVIGPGDNYNTSFSQTIPAMASLLGRSTLDLTIDGYHAAAIPTFG